MTLEELNKKYSYSDIIKERAINKVLKDLIHKAIKVSNNPYLVILGAQPGAGKTELQQIGAKRFENNIVICNADNYRNFCPNALEVKKQSPELYHAFTDPFAHETNKFALQKCVKEKYNILFETTFRDPKFLNNFISSFKNIGYKVDIMLLAVHPDISRINTFTRYENGLKHEKSGRMVTIHAHDSRFEALAPTVKGVQQAKLYDNLFLYTRQIMRDNDLKQGVFLHELNPKDPHKSFLGLVNKPLNEKARSYIEEQKREIMSSMQKRGASKEEMAEFSKLTHTKNKTLGL